MYFSVIIPTFNEARTMETSLTDLLNRQDNFEVIVADGGSTDGTIDVVRQFPSVKRIVAGKGRSRQLNAGAEAANGETFLFLHADTYLPLDAFRRIEDALSNPSVTGGCFCLRFDRDSFLLKMYSHFSRINHTLFTYGDQSLFIRSHIFREMTGFRDIPIMEDVEIQMRMRDIGKFIKIKSPVITSARKYVENGIIRQQVLNTVLVLLYHLGVSPSFLRRYYS